MIEGGNFHLSGRLKKLSFILPKKLLGISGNPLLGFGLTLFFASVQGSSAGILNKEVILNNLNSDFVSLTNFPNASYPGDGAYKSYDAGFKSWLTKTTCRF